jgi:ribose transport system ATP-binding protein
MSLPSPALNSATPLVQMLGIVKSYGGAEVLQGAHLRAKRGEVLGVVGENGAGKSTLMRILAGEVRRDSGEIRWLGEPARINSRADAGHLGITMIHQELSLAPHLTVAQNIFLGHEPVRYGLLASSLESAEARALLGKLDFRLDPDARVSRLSPAERQQVEIARAVARAQQLVVMDEPTSSLTAHEVADLYRVVRRLKSEGTAVIFVTHRLEELAEIADRVTVLRDGETVHEGPMPRRDFGELIRAMVGRELKDFYPRRSATIGAVALEVNGLARDGDFAEVSFQIRRGEVVGMAGLVGAGRTEVAEAIFGARPADRGTIRVEGREVRIRNPQDAIEHGIALITEDRKRTGLALHLSVAENVTLSNLAAISRKGVVDLRQESKVAESFIERLRVRPPSPRQKVARLSGGNQQRVVLAKWLFRQTGPDQSRRGEPPGRPYGNCIGPRIFIFDEPTRGVDVAAKAEIYAVINQLAESGAAILMISSELPELLGVSDRVLVMRNGGLVKELVTRDTSQEEIMRYATLAEL